MAQCVFFKSPIKGKNEKKIFTFYLIFFANFTKILDKCVENYAAIRINV